MILNDQMMRHISYQSTDTSNEISIEKPAIPTLVESAIPKYGDDEVLIKVKAAGINMADILQRRGRYPAPPGASEIPGLEVSGEIVGLGTKVSNWSLGDAVCALLAGGGYAEYVTVNHRNVLAVPPGMNFEQAAGIVEVAATCWANLFMQGGVRAGDWCLVHGGTGGIGSFAIQLLKAKGVKVVTTAGSAEKVQKTLTLGADASINYRTDDFSSVVQDITNGAGANVILDVIGGDYLAENIRALAKGGRLVIIGTQGGRTGSLNIGELMAKRAWVTGTTLRARTIDEKAEVLKGVEEHIWPLLASGEIIDSVEQTFPLDQVSAAQDAFLEPSRHGKVILTIQNQ